MCAAVHIFSNISVRQKAKPAALVTYVVQQARLDDLFAEDVVQTFENACAKFAKSGYFLAVLS